MRDWFNILIGLIAIVVAIAGSINKKKDAEKKRPGTSSPKPFMPNDDLFGELRRALSGEDEEDEKVEEAPSASETAYFRQPIVDEVPAPAVVVEENVQATTSFEDEDLTKPYQDPVSDKMKFELDAKQMIIFSAILKPKFEEN